jgi:hypothetical protein
LEKLGADQIKGKALDKWIDSDDLEYVMQVIRKEYLSNTSVTLYLIGQHSSENEGLDYEGYNKQSFIIRELQATLYDRKSNRRSGLLGIVLPEMESLVFAGKIYCQTCGNNHNLIKINDDSTIREFSQNYYLDPIQEGCKNAFEENGRFCVLIRYSTFMNDPDRYIDEAFDKTQDEISNRVHWRDIQHRGL